MIEYKNQMSIGIVEIDNQHMGLIAMIKKLNDAHDARLAPALVQKVLQDMMEYSLTHFSTEREIMEKAGYPDLHAHLEEHKAYVQLLQEKVKRNLAKNVVTEKELLTFLADWWLNHIKTTDMKFGRWFQEHKG